MQGHIIITGATGVIGTELALKLIEREEKVVVLARVPVVAARNIPGAAEYVQWDSGMESGEWTGFISGAKAVIHLAGKPLLESRWTEAHKNECYASRILGTRHIVSAIAAAPEKPQVFISASAIACSNFSFATLVNSILLSPVKSGKNTRTPFSSTFKDTPKLATVRAFSIALI